MSKALEEKVTKIIAEQLNIEESEITKEASFEEDLGADSLDVVELVMALEEAFNINIPDDDAEKIRNVGDAVTYINKQVGEES